MEPEKTVRLLGTRNVCLRVGRNLCRQYEHIRGTNRDVDDLNTRVENVWIDIESQLETVQSSPEAVPAILTEHMVDVLYRLQSRLHAAYGNLEKTTDKKGRAVTKTIWFTLFLKGSLEKDVSRLEKWRDMFAATFPIGLVPNSHEPNRVPQMKPRAVLRWLRRCGSSP